MAQVVTWLAFHILDPRVFPTSTVRQVLLQGLIYGMFLLAWWLIFNAATQRRTFAFIACVAGGVFFSGYVHLFHIYGLFYVPVILMLGSLLYSYASDTFDGKDTWFATIAIVLAFWHPFATALFLGFYFGFYMETFAEHSKAQHMRALVILLVGAMAIAGPVIFFPRTQLSFQTRLLGFLVSYKTNELNRIASIVAFLLAQMTVFSMGLSRRLSFAICVCMATLSAVCFLKNIPLLLLWLCAVLIKLLRLRLWSLLSLTVTAAVLPFGGGIGSPMYALFVIIVASYITAFGSSGGEKVLSVSSLDSSQGLFAYRRQL